MALRRGEKGILLLIAVVVLVYAANRLVNLKQHPVSGDPGIPFYSTASPDLARSATDIIRRERCRDCHTLWAVRNMMQAVPSPPLDGIGSLRDEAWFYRYFTAGNPQAILSSRLKPKSRMPSSA